MTGLPQKATKRTKRNGPPDADDGGIRDGGRIGRSRDDAIARHVAPNPKARDDSAPPRPITKPAVQQAFRGQRVEERADGSFRVYLENGKMLTVRKVDDVGKLSREAAERSIRKKLTDEEWANVRVRGVWTITSSDGRRTDTYGLRTIRRTD